MTGLLSPSRVAEATSGGSDVTSLGTSPRGSRAAQFSRTALRRLGGTLRAGTIRPEGDHRVYRPTLAPCKSAGLPGRAISVAAASSSAGPPDARVMALSDLQHL